jgi:hypothetical protein
MKTIRTLAAVLLLFTGVLHVIQLLLAKLDPGTIITVIFGVAYLIIAFFLFRPGKTVIWFGAILPLVGLLLAVVGMLTTPTALGVLFIAIDVIIIACCSILLFHKK